MEDVRRARSFARRIRLTRTRFVRARGETPGPLSYSRYCTTPSPTLPRSGAGEGERKNPSAPCLRISVVRLMRTRADPDHSGRFFGSGDACGVVFVMGGTERAARGGGARPDLSGLGFAPSTNKQLAGSAFTERGSAIAMSRAPG